MHQWNIQTCKHINSSLPSDSPSVTVFLCHRQPPRERCGPFPWSLRATVRGDAVFLRRHYPSRDTPFVESSHREEEKSSFSSPEEERRKRERRERRNAKKHATPPLLSPMNSWHVAIKRRAFALLIKGRVLV